MTTNKRCINADDEYKKIFRVLNFRLPHIYKRLGLVGAAIIFILLLGTKFFDVQLVMKDVARTLILLFLLIASLSKDEIEDEYIVHVRSQSYVIAFLFALGYAIIIPLIAVVLDFLMVSITQDGKVGFYEISSFEVMFTLVCVQMLFFEVMKKVGRAQ